jgi:two-component system, LytTR family, response regulator
MIRTIVVDDEKPSREVMCNYLMEFCPDVEIVASASSVKTAYKSIRKKNPDVVFLDIEMADGKGFDLLKLFDRIDFKVIFVTAYSNYAIKAFRFNAIDYLLKPIKIDELQAAVAKISKSNKDNHAYPEQLATLLKNLAEGNGNHDTITISHLKGFEVLKICDIIMCIADGYCTNFYLTGKRKVTSSKNLKHYEDLLTSYKFIRVHHSFLINLKHVCSYTSQGEIVLTENNKAFLGENFKQMFISKFNVR